MHSRFYRPSRTGLLTIVVFAVLGLLWGGLTVAPVAAQGDPLTNPALNCGQYYNATVDAAMIADINALRRAVGVPELTTNVPGLTSAARAHQCDLRVRQASRSSWRQYTAIHGDQTAAHTVPNLPNDAPFNLPGGAYGVAPTPLNEAGNACSVPGPRNNPGGSCFITAGQRAAFYGAQAAAEIIGSSAGLFLTSPGHCSIMLAPTAGSYGIGGAVVMIAFDNPNPTNVTRADITTLCNDPNANAGVQAWRNQNANATEGAAGYVPNAQVYEIVRAINERRAAENLPPVGINLYLQRVVDQAGDPATAQTLLNNTHHTLTGAYPRATLLDLPRYVSQGRFLEGNVGNVVVSIEGQTIRVTYVTSGGPTMTPSGPAGSLPPAPPPADPPPAEPPPTDNTAGTTTDTTAGGTTGGNTGAANNPPPAEPTTARVVIGALNVGDTVRVTAAEGVTLRLFVSTDATTPVAEGNPLQHTATTAGTYGVIATVPAEVTDAAISSAIRPAQPPANTTADTTTTDTTNTTTDTTSTTGGTTTTDTTGGTTNTTGGQTTAPLTDSRFSLGALNAGDMVNVSAAPGVTLRVISAADPSTPLAEGNPLLYSVTAAGTYGLIAGVPAGMADPQVSINVSTPPVTGGQTTGGSTTTDTTGGQTTDTTGSTTTDTTTGGQTTAPTNDDLIAQLVALVNAERTTPIQYSGVLTQIAAAIAGGGDPFTAGDPFGVQLTGGSAGTFTTAQSIFDSARERFVSAGNGAFGIVITGNRFELVFAATAPADPAASTQTTPTTGGTTTDTTTGGATNTTTGGTTTGTTTTGTTTGPLVSSQAAGVLCQWNQRLLDANPQSPLITINVQAQAVASAAVAAAAPGSTPTQISAAVRAALDAAGMSGSSGGVVVNRITLQQLLDRTEVGNVVLLLARNVAFNAQTWRMPIAPTDLIFVNVDGACIGQTVAQRAAGTTTPAETTEPTTDDPIAQLIALANAERATPIQHSGVLAQIAGNIAGGGDPFSAGDAFGVQLTGGSGGTFSSAQEVFDRSRDRFLDPGNLAFGIVFNNGRFELVFASSVPAATGGTTTDGQTTPPTDGQTTPPTDGQTTPPTDGQVQPPTDNTGGQTAPPPTGGSTISFPVAARMIAENPPPLLNAPNGSQITTMFSNENITVLSISADGQWYEIRDSGNTLGWVPVWSVVLP